jgi:GGDEF domain-containing protein
MSNISPFFHGSRRNGSGDRKADALVRVVSILLQGVVRHSFESDSADAAAFQTSLRKVRTEFEQAVDEDSALLLAGSAVRLMEDYNQSAQSRAAERRQELESAVVMVSEALLDIAGATVETRVRMKEISADLASAGGVDELRTARKKLAEAVGRIRDDYSHPLKKFGKEIPRGDVDSVTGLPDYGFGAGAIAEVWHRREDFYAAIFAAERLESINARFGYQAGDEILMLLSRRAAQSLTPADRLFRWRGPCVAALMKRNAPEALVASELNRVTSTKIEHAITLRERQVMLPVSMSWNLFPLHASSEIGDLLGRMNSFAAGRALPGKPPTMLNSTM